MESKITFPPADAGLVKRADCHATLVRLVGNLRGFLYRRRLDPRWTMEFVSAGIRDLTGYDPHRFIANASIAFGGLIAPSDRKRVNERVHLAVQHRERATIEYLIRTAYGAWLRVEDRFIPVVNPAGKVLAVEGIIDRACSRHAPAVRGFPPGPRFAAAGNFPSLN